MARTRGEIITLVKAHVGWEDRTDKDTLIDSLCDSALKYALTEHDFRGLITTTSSESEITEGDDSVDLSGYNLLNIITARLLSSSSGSSDGHKLSLRDRQWWDNFIIEGSIQTQGTPELALHEGSTLYFNVPCNSGWKLRLRYTTVNTYTNDSTETPSEFLDLFVEYKVTADLFFSLEDMEKFAMWNRRAIGNNPEFPGGELARAIRADQREASKDRISTRPWGLLIYRRPSITTKDLNWTIGDPHSQYRTWN